MRNLIGSFFVICTGVLCGQEFETRAYQVDYERWSREGFGVITAISSEGNMNLFSSRLAFPDKAPFESRFFHGERSFVDLTASQKAQGFLWGDEAKMVYTAKSKLLVVRADVVNHHLIESYFERFIERQLMMEIELFKVKEVGDSLAEGRALAPGEAESLGAMSGVIHVSQAGSFRAKELGLRCQVETRLGTGGKVWYSVLKLVSHGAGVEFEMDTELVGVLGVPLVVSLGSSDGKTSLSLRVTMKLVRQDGSDFDGWVQSENEKGFLMKKRLRVLAKARGEEPEITTLENGIQRASFRVPKTFFDPFEDPFEHRFGDDTGGADRLLKLLKDRGVKLGKRDRAILIPAREGGVLFLQSTKENVEILKSLVFGVTPPPALLSCDLYLVESDEKLDGKRLKEGDLRVIRQISSSQASARFSKIRLGKDLQLEATLQLDAGEEMVEVKLSGGRKVGEFEAEAALKPGEPVVLQQVETDAEWRSWVLVTSKVWMQEIAMGILAGQ